MMASSKQIFSSVDSEQDCFIFDYKDIADLIFDKLDFVTITEVALVCKRFASLSKEHYYKRLKVEILNPARYRYDEFYLHYMHTYLSNKYYSFFYRMCVDHFLKMLNRYIHFIAPFVHSNYWLLFLYDFDVTENMLMFVSRLNHIIHYNKQFIFFDTNIDEDEHARRILIYCRINKIFNTLDKYLYLKYPCRYTNSDLHMVAKFKKIDNHCCMNNVKLSKALERQFCNKYIA